MGTYLSTYERNKGMAVAEEKEIIEQHGESPDTHGRKPVHKIKKEGKKKETSYKCGVRRLEGAGEHINDVRLPPPSLSYTNTHQTLSENVALKGRRKKAEICQDTYPLA